MSQANRTRPLAFDGKYVRGHLVENAKDFIANGVVTNLSNEAMIVGGDIIGIVPPWKSTMLRGGNIAQAERVSIVDVPDLTNLGGLVFDGWDWFGNRMAEFPRTTPLYISKHDIVGDVTLNPWHFSNHPAPPSEVVHFDIQLNLWWAPAKTDAVIHNTHHFLEIHTQIFGLGRIQIFKDQAGTEMYREISTAPGDTHDPIVRVADARTYTYPWHRGWTDEDCIWMAIELHPKAR